jgi:hypothetical protein
MTDIAYCCMKESSHNICVFATYWRRRAQYLTAWILVILSLQQAGRIVPTDCVCITGSRADGCITDKWLTLLLTISYWFIDMNKRPTRTPLTSAGRTVCADASEPCATTAESVVTVRLGADFITTRSRWKRLVHIHTWRRDTKQH